MGPTGAHMECCLGISEGESAEEAIIKSQSVYNALLTWCNFNRLTINESKTKHMVFNCKRKSLMPTLCNNGAMENVHSYKYLGVHIDDILSYDNFAESVWDKVNIRLFNFAKIT